MMTILLVSMGVSVIGTYVPITSAATAGTLTLLHVLSAINALFIYSTIYLLQLWLKLDSIESRLQDMEEAAEEESDEGFEL